MGEGVYAKVHESDYDAGNFDVVRRDRVLSVNMTYPGWDESDKPEGVREIEVNQESVRASDGIRLVYDYQRDGWSIRQPKRIDTLIEVKDGIAHYDCDEEWIETAFVQSWAFLPPEDS